MLPSGSHAEGQSSGSATRKNLDESSESVNATSPNLGEDPSIEERTPTVRSINEEVQQIVLD